MGGDREMEAEGKRNEKGIKMCYVPTLHKEYKYYVLKHSLLELKKCDLCVCV